MKKLIKALRLFSTIIPIYLTGCSAQETLNPDNYTDRQSGFGARVIIETINGDHYFGELIAVKDTLIIICETYGISETNLSKGVYPLKGMQSNQITLLVIKGEKHILTGIAIGGGIGAALGAAAGASMSGAEWEILFPQSEEEDIASGACCLGVTGGLIGGLFGLVNSTKDKIIYNNVESSQIDYIFLKQFARYPEQEPEYIRVLR